MKSIIVKGIGILVVVLMGMPMLNCKESSDDSLFQLSILYLLVRATTSPNVRYTNSSLVTGNAGLYTDSSCSSVVSGTSVSSLSNGGTTSSFSAFTAGTYYVGLTTGPVGGCSSSSFGYTNSLNYTVTISTTGYSISGVPQ